MKVRVFRTYLQFDTMVMERYTRKERLLVESSKMCHFKFKVKIIHMKKLKSTFHCICFV
jgi:hypothetical protein